VIGNFVANVYEHMGWDVVRLNYLGDWGKQIGVFAAALRRYGSEELLESDPLSHIHEIYDKIREPLKREQEAQRLAREDGQTADPIQGDSILAERDAFFKKMEERDPNAIALWARIRDYTLESLKSAYQRFGVRFDEYCGESKINPETITEIETKFKESGEYEESEGAWVVDFEKHNWKGLVSQTLRDRSGSSTYLLRDVAAALERDRSFAFDKMIYVVSSRQNLHFRQVMKVLELLGRADLAVKLEHVSFGEMQGIAKHLEDAYSLGRILDVCGNMLRAAPATSGATEILVTPGDGAAVSVLATVAVSTIKRAQAVTLEPQKMTSVEGESSLTLHTCMAKLSHAIVELQTNKVETAQIDYSSLEDDSTAELLGLMAQFPDIVATAYRTLEPHGALTYLLRLANAIMDDVMESESEEEADTHGVGEDAEEVEEAENKHEGGEEESAESRRARLELYKCAEQVLQNGMKLLGLPVIPISSVADHGPSA
jgi:arginyl-tRNA synthetase